MSAFQLRRAVSAFALAATLALAFAVAPTPASAQTEGSTVTTPSGLKITDTKVGTGAEAKNDLEKVNTNRSTKSGRSVRVLNEDAYDGNPYAIDRVNTRESFARVARANSGASRKSRK